VAREEGSAVIRGPGGHVLDLFVARVDQYTLRVDKTVVDHAQQRIALRLAPGDGTLRKRQPVHAGQVAG
jgi:hypothetical protein